MTFLGEKCDDESAPLSTSTPTRTATQVGLPRVAERSQVVRAGELVDPPGLSLLYNPLDDNSSADIIFVHGLGGSSRMTWSHDRDLGKFWPREWLPKDRHLRQSRIFTFGYDAKYKNKLQSSSLGISDFSENLLFDMMYGRDAGGNLFRFGQVSSTQHAASTRPDREIRFLLSLWPIQWVVWW